MISVRTADILERVKNQREKLTLIVAICMSSGQDAVLFWIYDSEGNLVNLSSSSSFLHNVMLNAMQVTNMTRSFDTVFNDQFNFDENLPVFVNPTKATNNPRKSSQYSMLMGDFYTAMKRGAMAFVGESEHHFNDNGVCFGVIELFKPKFNSGEYVKFKDKDGDIVSGLVIGLDGGNAQYTVSHDGIETEVAERDLIPSEAVAAVSFRKKADIALNVLERERQKFEANKIDKYPLDDITTNPSILAIITDTVQAFHDKIEQEYETYGGDDEVEVVASASGPGFHDFTNGRASISQFTTLSNIFGSGRWPNNEAIRNKMSLQEDEALNDAKNSFISEYGNQLKEAGIDLDKDVGNINYHYLYEKNLSKLAERLSEEETEHMDRYVYNFRCEVRYFNPTNTNRDDDESGLPEVNFVAELGGHENALDYSAVDERFTFSTLSELREKLTSCLNRAVEALS